MNGLSTKHISLWITILMLPVIMHWFMRGAAVGMRREGKIAWLEYGPRIKWSTLLPIALAGLFCFGWITAPPEHKGKLFWLTIFLSVVTVCCIVETFLFRVGCDRHQIYCRSGWRASRVVEWREIKSVKYARLLGWVLRTEKSGNIYLTKYLSGLPDFLKKLKGHGLKCESRESIDFILLRYLFAVVLIWIFVKFA